MTITKKKVITIIRKFWRSNHHRRATKRKADNHVSCGIQLPIPMPQRPKPRDHRHQETAQSSCRNVSWHHAAAGNEWEPQFWRHVCLFCCSWRPFYWSSRSLAIFKYVRERSTVMELDFRFEAWITSQCGQQWNVCHSLTKSQCFRVARLLITK
jgi:hypothetical protein